MARNREKKALYEVIGQTLKSQSDGAPEDKLHPDYMEDEQIEHGAAKLQPQKLGRWVNKPKIAQFNFGRIEMSISYPLAIALLLGLILLLLVAFRLGQMSASGKADSTAMLKNTQRAKFEPVVSSSQSKEKEQTSSFPPKFESVTTGGDNRIVIQTYQVRTDLHPVRQYFAKFGIETEIIKLGDWYYLVTVNKYDNPEKPGTDGYAAKQKIIELGADYKAPAGYETFGSKPFRDAYGKKFDE